jgi:hypothetical protein
MANDISDAIADLVLKSAPDLRSGLASQTQALAEVECSHPLIGRWLDANDLDYLLAVFELNDKDFSERFPTAIPTSSAERKELIKTFQRHVIDCRHCRLKHQYDRELDEQIDRTLQENREALLAMLKQEPDDEDPASDIAFGSAK